jgi:hypothetical protein
MSIDEAQKIDDKIWSVGIGFGTKKVVKGYDAHLVTIAEENIIIDLTNTQVNRPQHQIGITPFVSVMPPEFFQGEPVHVEHSTGELAIYTKTENNSYTEAPDWVNKDRRMEIVHRIVRRIRNH